MGIDSPQQLGLVFCGWGVLVAVFAVWGAPWLKARFGTARTLYGNFVLMALDLAAIGIWPDSPTVVIVAVIVAGAFIGVNNTLVTTAVMSIAPVERPVASATYGFVRFIGGGLAPFAAGKLVEHFNAHVPFLIGAGTVVLAAFALSTVHAALTAADAGWCSSRRSTTSTGSSARTRWRWALRWATRAEARRSASGERRRSEDLDATVLGG